jgi:hypothetical protein
MASGHNIDVFRSTFLEEEAYFHKVPRRNPPAHPLLRDLVILAKRAAKVTACDKNGS